MPVSNKTNGTEDIGEYLGNAVRIADNQLPYRDFWLLLPPMEAFVPAALYGAFGADIPLALGINSGISALTAALAFLLGRLILTRAVYAVAFSLLVFTDSALLYYAGWNHSNWFMLLLVAAAYCFALNLKSGRTGALIYAGGLAALATSFRIYEAFPFYAGGLTALNVRADTGARSRVLKSGLFLTTFVALWIALIAVFFPASYEAVFQETIIDSVRHAAASYKGIALDLREDIAGMKANARAGLLHAWRFSYYGNALLRHSLNYAAIIIAVCSGLIALRKKETENKPVILWLFVWLVLGLGKLREGLGSNILGFALVPAFLLVLIYAEKKPAMRIFALLLVISSLYGAAGDYAAKLLRNVNPVRSVAGTIFTDDARFAEETEAVLNKVEIAAGGGERIAALHRGPYPFSMASGRQSAIRYDSLIDLFYRPDAAKELSVCEDIVRNDARILIVQPAIMQEGPAFATLKTCINRSFDIGSVYGNYLLYYPRTAP